MIITCKIIITVFCVTGISTIIDYYNDRQDKYSDVSKIFWVMFGILSIILLWAFL